MDNRLRTLKFHLLVLGFYAGLTCLALYWPLIHANTHIPAWNVSDYFHFHWSYWWTGHALATPGLSVFETDFVLAPFKTNLAYHTYSPFWFPLWAALKPIVGTLIAVQVIIVTALSLTGYTVFLLLRQEKVMLPLALAGGVLVQLSSAMIEAVMKSVVHYLGFWWLPLQIILWTRVTRNAHNPRRAFFWAVVQGIAFYLMLMTDYQYGLYSIFLLAPSGIMTLINVKSNQIRIRLVGLGVLAIALMILGLWFFGPLRQLLTFDTSTLVRSDDNTYVIDFPLDYIRRLPLTTEEITLGSIIIPATLLTMLIRPWRPDSDKRAYFWLGISILPLLLSAGTTINLLGIAIPMPYRFLNELLGGLFRSVHRFGVVFTIPALVFIGRSWSGFLQRRKTSVEPVITAILILLVLVDARFFTPIPIRPVAPYYTFYERMGEEKGPAYDDYVVVEVPTAAGTGESYVGQDYFDMETQFYGITHHKRMINGLIARAPVNHWFYLRTDDPMLSWLGQRRYLEPEQVEQQLKERIFDWPIGYIVIHQDKIGHTSPANQEIIGYFNQLDTLLCPVWVERDAVVYRTTWHPDGCPARTPPEIEPSDYRIDIGASGDEKFLGWGWHRAEDVAGLPVRWTGDWHNLVAGSDEWLPNSHPQAEIFVDLLPTDYTMTITAQSYQTDRQIEVLVNDIPIGKATVSASGLQPVSFDLPEETLNGGQHIRLTFRYQDTALAGDRQLALMVSQIDLSAIKQPE